MCMYFEYRLKDHLGLVPGVWEDSTLYFKAKGPKNVIARIGKAIQKAIAEEEEISVIRDKSKE